MKLLKYLIPAIIVLSSIGVAHAQVSNPQWKINNPSSTITPINSSLQVPCANIVGGCGAGGSATTTINGVKGPTFTVSIVTTSSPSSITTSTAQVLLNLLTLSSSSDVTISTTGTIIFASNNISQFTNNSGYGTSNVSTSSVNTWSQPQTFTSGINSNGTSTFATSTQTTVDSYVSAAATSTGDYGTYLNSLCTSVASGTTINLPQGTLSYGQTVNVTQHCTYQGVGGGGTILLWTGALGGTMVNENWGTLPHDQGGGINNLTLNCNGSASATGTVGLLLGGTAPGGATHPVNSGLTITNCGVGFKTSTGTYMSVLQNTTLVLNARNLWITTSSNSGESMEFTNVFSLDCANSTTTKCDYFGNNSLENATWTGGSVDDVGSYYENGVNLSYFGVNFENPGYPTYGQYDYHQLASSFYGTIITWYGGNMQNDATNTAQAPVEFVNGGGIAEFFGLEVSKGNSSAAAVPELFNNGISSVNGIAQACGVVNMNNGGNALTSIFPAGNTTNSENWGCLIYNQNNYVQGVDYTSGATNFYHGGGIKASIANNGIDLGAGTTPTTTVMVTGSLGGNANVIAVSSTVTVTSPQYQVFTGSAIATDTLPVISVSQGQTLTFKDRGTAALSIQGPTSTLGFIWLSASNASATTYSLTPGSSTAFYNDGTYWDQLWK